MRGYIRDAQIQSASDSAARKAAVVPTLEDLEPRLHVVDIRAVKTGTECDFIKEYKKDFKDQYSKLALSLMGDNTSLLDLVAPDDQTFNYWLDGLNR